MSIAVRTNNDLFSVRNENNKVDGANDILRVNRLLFNTIRNLGTISSDYSLDCASE